MKRSPKRIRLTVTQKDIAAGCPNDGQNCPFTIALRRRFPKATYIKVGRHFVYVVEPTLGELTFVNSPRAVQWIDDFDQRPRSRSQPGTFVLTLCDF